jgi:HNH endonuclease
LADSDALLFTYNPDKNGEEPWSQWAKRTKPRMYWSTTSPGRTHSGSRFYMLQQGKRWQKGIFGAGSVVGPPKPDPDWGHLVRIEFSDLVDPADDRFLIPEKVLRRIVGEAGKPVLARPQRSGLVVRTDIAEAFDHEIARHRRNEGQSSPTKPLPPKAEAEREELTREIRARQGAGPFRNALMRAYGKSCAITGCKVHALLEAAHIVRYADRGANTTSNGLLLRADIHTAFDLHLIWVDADTMEVRVAPSLMSDPAYRHLEGQRLLAPALASSAPDASLLRQHAALARKKRQTSRPRRAD